MAYLSNYNVDLCAPGHDAFSLSYKKEKRIITKIRVELQWQLLLYLDQPVCYGLSIRI